MSETLFRHQLSSVQAALERGKSVLLMGARQTGKTTLVEQLPADRFIRLAQPAVRLQYEKDIASFTREIESLLDNSKSQPLIIIDEVQKIPALFDSVQDLIDRKVAQFVLTGSSARKLKKQSDLNLLPGRVVVIHMCPLGIDELPQIPQEVNNLLYFGSLPEITLLKNDEDKNQDLASYVLTYLEEEVRQEALVRQIGEFNRFLELAAAESGYSVNMSKLSREIGVASTTIESYYQILVDCLIAIRVEVHSTSATRKKLKKAAKYLFFDLGLRRLGAREGMPLPDKYLGHLFEQWVGLELFRYIQSKETRAKLLFWQDLSGREIDWIIQIDKKLILIEVKWTKSPSAGDAKHLHHYIENYAPEAKGYVICRCEHSQKISENVNAIPWQQILSIFK